jgi:hypothetical protein
MNVTLLTRCASISACLFALLAATSVSAESFASHTSAILRAAAKPSPQALAAADAAYAEAIAVNADDARADYALALARLRGSQWASAAEALASATRKAPHDVRAWRAYVWLLLYQRQFTPALAEIDRFVPVLAVKGEAEAPTAEQRLEAAKLMGRAYGYLAGPRSGAIPADELTVRHTKLTAKLSPGQAQAFAAGEAEIATIYGEAIAAIEAEKQSVLATNVEEQAAQREFIDSERSRINTEAATLAEQAESAKGQFDADVSVIDQELTPIQQRYNEVQFAAQPFIERMRQLEQRLAFAQSEVARVDVGDGKDPERVRRDRERREAAQRDAEALRFDLRREQDFLRPYQIEGQQLQAAAAQLAARRAAAAAAYQRTIGSLEAARRKLQRVEIQLQNSERALAKPASNTSGKTMDLKSRLPLLTTYEKFPLDEERLRLLKELALE